MYKRSFCSLSDISLQYKMSNKNQSGKTKEHKEEDPTYHTSFYITSFFESPEVKEVSATTKRTSKIAIPMKIVAGKGSRLSKLRLQWR